MSPLPLLMIHDFVVVAVAVVQRHLGKTHLECRFAEFEVPFGDNLLDNCRQLGVYREFRPELAFKVDEQIFVNLGLTPFCHYSTTSLN